MPVRAGLMRVLLLVLVLFCIASEAKKKKSSKKNHSTLLNQLKNVYSVTRIIKRLAEYVQVLRPTLM